MNIEVRKLDASKLNPRRRTDAQKIKELEASIRDVGVLQPLLVRPSGSRFEVVAGNRRLEAARKAGLEELPCEVREIGDEEYSKIALIENLQREDLDAIDEGRAFRELLKTRSIDDVAREIGRSRAYVMGRTRLDRAGKIAEKAYREGRMDISALIMMSTAEGETLKHLEREVENTDGPVVSATYLLRSLGHGMPPLSSAPFKKDVKIAGVVSCLECPKRTGFEPDLFGRSDSKSTERCLDNGCFDKKVEAHLQSVFEKANKNGTAVRISADYYNVPKKVLSRQQYRTWKSLMDHEGSVPGVICHVGWQDKDLGKVIPICTHKECLGKENRDGSSSESHTTRAKKRWNMEIRNEAQRLALKAAMEENLSPPESVARETVRAFYRRTWSENQKRLAQLLNLKISKKSVYDLDKDFDRELAGKSNEEIVRLLQALVLVQDFATSEWQKPDQFWKVASTFGLSKKEYEAAAKAALKDKMARSLKRAKAMDTPEPKLDAPKKTPKQSKRKKGEKAA